MLGLDANRKHLYIRWVLIRLGLVLFDIFAVNFAYYFALLVRFYVNFEFSVWALKYVPAFLQFAPLYTLSCLGVFALLGLYNSLWKYASTNDVIRIIMASLITCAIQVVGSIVLVMRMPISYYGLGAAFQFVLITLSRFSYRIIMIEKSRFFKARKKGAHNALIVGTGESVRTVIKRLDRDVNSKIQPVCVMDFDDDTFRGTIAGVPVIGGFVRIRQAIKDYKVDSVILADSFAPSRLRKKISETCQETGIRVQTFSECFQGSTSKITAKTMLEHFDGAVELVVDGEIRSYNSSDEAIEDLKKDYVVAFVRVHDGRLQAGLIQDILLQSDTQTEWIQEYQRETGEDISFF